MRILIALLLFVAIFCFALGITLPILHMQKLYFFEETPSILSLTHALWLEDDGLLKDLCQWYLLHAERTDVSFAIVLRCMQ